MAARCFSPPERTGGNAAHTLAKTNPLQQLDDLGPVFGFVLAEHAQRQRHVLVGGHMVEQPEVLEDDADAAAQGGAAILAQRRGVLVEHRDQTARRPQRQEQQAKQRSLAGARRPGQELERMPFNAEGDVAQNLRTNPAQADIFESDHAVLPRNLPPRGACAELVSQFRSSQVLAAHSRANFGIENLVAA